jgi:hypothetical protein
MGGFAGVAAGAASGSGGWMVMALIMARQLKPDFDNQVIVQDESSILPNAYLLASTPPCF